MEELIMLKRRPKTKPARTFESLCILVLAGSGSMQELCSQHLSKGEKVGLAVHDMFVRLKESRYAPCFDFAIVNYDHRSIIKMYPTSLKQINPDSDFNPSLGLGGGHLFLKNPTGPSSGTYRVLHGGSWLNRPIENRIGFDLLKREVLWVFALLFQYRNPIKTL